MTATDKRPLEAALEYAALGWRVFPVYEMNGAGCSCAEGAGCSEKERGKHPRITGNLIAASTERAQIENWWTRWPAANIGIATGRESNLTVVDVDVSDGKPGLVNITTLCAPHGGLPQTMIANSGSGGLHLYFKYTDRLPNRENVLAEAVDVRNDGGYIIAPPSNHRSGGTYQWRNGVSDLPPLLPVPDWMQASSRESQASSRSKRRWKNLTIEQVADALKHVDPEDRDRWLKVGIILGRYFKRSPAAWDLYESWSARSPKYDEDRAGNLMRMREMFHEKSAEKPPRGGDEIGLGSLIEWAEGWEIPQDGDAAYDNFYFIRPANRFLYVPSGALWPSESVNSALKARLIGYNDKGQPMFEKPSAWLSENRGINSMIFDPERDQITPDAVYRDQEVIEKPGATMFNTYHPSTLKLGVPSEAAPWIEHVHKLLPKTAEADHLIAWCAQRVQKPGEKVRHAILIGGPPGIGKDTIFEGIVPAIGAWNCASIAPDDLFSAFNEFKATIFLRVNEVVDLHEMSRFKLHEATKNLISGTPDYMTVNPKYGTKYATRNVCGIVMTTNHPTTGIYLPADDRRHFCVETIQLWGTEDERAAYFQTLWDWLLRGGGFAHVAAFLHSIDLNSFDPNRPPPKTETFWQIVAHGMTGDEWLTEALDKLDNPPMVRLDELREKCVSEDLDARQFSIRIGPALSRAGYELLKNPTRQDGRHDLLDHNEKRACVAVYVRRGTPNATLAGLLAGIRTAKF